MNNIQYYSITVYTVYIHSHHHYWLLLILVFQVVLAWRIEWDEMDVSKKTTIPLGLGILSPVNCVNSGSTGKCYLLGLWFQNEIYRYSTVTSSGYNLLFSLAEAHGAGTLLLLLVNFVVISVTLLCCLGFWYSKLYECFQLWSEVKKCCEVCESSTTIILHWSVCPYFIYVTL